MDNSFFGMLNNSTSLTPEEEAALLALQNASEAQLSGFDVSDDKVVEEEENSLVGAEIGSESCVSDVPEVTEVSAEVPNEVSESIKADSDASGVTFDTQDSKYTETRYRHDDIIRPFDEANKLNYPLLLMSCETIERFRVEVLKGMLKNSTFIENNEALNVYLEISGQKVGIGIVTGDMLRELLNNPTFRTFEKKIYLDNKTCYEGDMLYAFCTVID